MQQLHAQIQVQIEAQRGIETKEARLTKTVAKFVGALDERHLAALRAVAAGRAPKRGKVLSDLFFWGCIGTAGMRITDYGISQVGRAALAALEERYAARKAAESTVLFEMYNA